MSNSGTEQSPGPPAKRRRHDADGVDDGGASAIVAGRRITAAFGRAFLSTFQSVFRFPRPFRSNLSEDGKVLSISIPPDLDHNWVQTDTKTLFVRSCYNDLWKHIADEYFTADGSNNSIQGFVISGSPGVGKSSFLDFCLHKLLELGKSVCYFYGKGGTAKNRKITVKEYENVVDEEMLANQVDFLLIDPPEGSSENFLGGRVGLDFVLAISF